MDAAATSGTTAPATTENGSRIKSTESASTSGPMAESTMDNGKMENNMEKGTTQISKEDVRRDIGMMDKEPSGQKKENEPFILKVKIKYYK